MLKGNNDKRELFDMIRIEKNIIVGLFLSFRFASAGTHPKVSIGKKRGYHLL